MLKKLFFFFIAALIGAAAFLFKDLTYQYSGPDKTFTIGPGEHFARINSKLFQQGIVQNPRFFHHYTKYQNKLTSFKVGSFIIHSGMSYADILHHLTQGTPILTKTTIPEGKNMYEVAHILESKGITSKNDFLELTTDAKLLKKYDIPGPSVEGYLYPETYKFSPNTPAKTVITTMLNLFFKKIKEVDLTLAQTIRNKKMNLQEIITLASIVEKETGASWERALIAGVYLNRLKKPMRLQADPTTIYGIWKVYKGNLRKRHLREKTPYNTYRIDGLPLGPIANPSLLAIKAVLRPKEHKYLYFVSKNDGTHIFSETYKKHLKAVRNYQLNRANREGKSWRDLKR